MDFQQMPIGFAMALAQNPAAMETYAALPRETPLAGSRIAEIFRSRGRIQRTVRCPY